MEHYRVKTASLLQTDEENSFFMNKFIKFINAGQEICFAPVIDVYSTTVKKENKPIVRFIITYHKL